MRSIASEIVSAAIVLTIPVALIAIFPYSAIGFRAQDPIVTDHSSSAFVTLDENAERVAVAAAKSSWQSSLLPVRDLRTDLSFGELPDEKPVPMLDVGSRLRPPQPRSCVLPLPPYLPSQAAPAPQKLNAFVPETPMPPFSREELSELR